MWNVLLSPPSETGRRGGNVSDEAQVEGWQRGEPAHLIGSLAPCGVHVQQEFSDWLVCFVIPIALLQIELIFLYMKPTKDEQVYAY